MELLYLPFVLVVAFPPAAFVVAALIAICFAHGRPYLGRSSKRWVVCAVLGWSVYGVYECAMWVWSQGVVAPIRVDLLLVAPVLYVLSLVAVRAFWLVRRAHGSEPGAA